MWALGYHVVLAILGVASAIVLSTKDAFGWPGYALIGATWVSVFLAGVEQIRRAFREYLGERDYKRIQRVNEVLRAGFTDVVREAGLDWNSTGIRLGLNAFFVKRRWWPPFRRELMRYGQARITISNPSGIRWTRGKGVIGRCWQERQDAGRNQAADYGPYINSSETEWTALDPAFRDRLDFDEFRRVKHYGAVIATPITDERGRFVGCISVDAPGNCYNQLWDERVRLRLHAIGRLARIALGGR